MKYPVIFVCFLQVLSCKFTVGQITSGKILYEKRIDVHRTISKEQEPYKAMIKQFRSVDYELLFSNNRSVFKIPDNDAPPETANVGGVTMQSIGFGEGDNCIYIDYNSKIIVEQKELGNRYLIKDSADNYRWKLSDSVEIILGYHCYKAEMILNGKKITAWYTDQISCFSGPGLYCGLPGLILKVDEDDAAVIYTATKFDKTVDEKEIREPRKGKEVTREEFEEIYKKQMNNMRSFIREG